MLRRICLFTLLTYLALSAGKSIKNVKSEVRKFPEWFEFGTATASYQIEGAWDADGKSPSIWDTVSHQEPCIIKECHTGDVADDSYNNVQRDVQMMRELGLDYYRFSLSWPRILPTSFPDKINEAGVQYYNNLINEMLKYNIEPMVTLYHWDLPQKLQDLGGWTNPHVVDWFSDYARTCFDLFGDRVKKWITINEPREICYQGYGAALLAPYYNYDGYANYMCSKNLLVAHATVYHIYDKEYRSVQGGVVGITISSDWHEPESDSEEDINAAEVDRQFNWGIYAYPIFSETGDFPAILKEKVATKSAEQGYMRSRLPEFTAEEIELIRGSSDYFGINHYTSLLSYKNDSVYGLYQEPSMYDDMDVANYQPEEWDGAKSSWLKTVPWGFYKLLTYIRENYNNPPVYITENGFSTDSGLDDDKRVNYYLLYLDALLDAVDEGSNVRGYTAWSLMDNFEWTQGYTERFGLYEVNYEDPARTRTPRKSAFVYKQIVRSRELDLSYEPPADAVMTIDEGH